MSTFMRLVWVKCCLRVRKTNNEKWDGKSEGEMGEKNEKDQEFNKIEMKYFINFSFK